MEHIDSYEWESFPHPSMDARIYRNRRTGEQYTRCHNGNVEPMGGYGVIEYLSQQQAAFGQQANAQQWADIARAQAHYLANAQPQVNQLCYTQQQRPQSPQAALSNVMPSTAQSLTTKKKEYSMFGSVKKYFDDHRELIMTLALLVIIDQWVFDGAFKEKIKSLIDRVVSHADNKVKTLESKV